jgi:hypothetical protein
MTDELEPGVTVQVLDVAFAAGEEVVHAEDFVAGSQQAVAEV